MKLVIRIVLISIAVIIGIFTIYFIVMNTERPKTIGIVTWTDSPDYSTNIVGFKNGLSTMGFNEGSNVIYLEESAVANSTMQNKIIEKFKEKKIDLIYSLTTPGTLIAKKEVTEIPIVFSIVTYPENAGLIKKWYASENNLVGTSNHISIDKQFSFYSNILPITKIAFVHRKGEINSQTQLQELKIYAIKNNIKIIDIAATNLEDLREKVTRTINQVDATYQSCDTLIQNGGEQIVISIAMAHKKPSFSCNKAGAEEGALASDAADLYKLGLSSGQKAGLILQGIRPSSLISDVDADEYTVINLKTAHFLGLDIPEFLKLEATEVVK